MATNLTFDEFSKINRKAFIAKRSLLESYDRRVHGLFISSHIGAINGILATHGTEKMMVDARIDELKREILSAFLHLDLLASSVNTSIGDIIKESL